MGWKFPATGAVGWNSGVEISCNWGRRVEQRGGNLLQLGAVGWNNGVEISCNWGRRVEQWGGNFLQLWP